MSETELVRRLQAGDRAAVSGLYAIYAETAVRTAFLITRNAAAAEDAVQEAFVQVIRSVSALRDAGAFRPWFYRIVVNASKRLTRTISRSLPLDLTRHDQIDLAAVSPDEAAITSAEVESLRQAVACLNPTHRAVIILRYYTGLSEEEMAVALGVPAGTVKSRLHRAREALHECLEREGVKGS